MARELSEGAAGESDRKFWIRMFKWIVVGLIFAIALWLGSNMIQGHLDPGTCINEGQGRVGCRPVPTNITTGPESALPS